MALFCIMHHHFCLSIRTAQTFIVELASFHIKHLATAHYEICNKKHLHKLHVCNMDVIVHDFQRIRTLFLSLSRRSSAEHQCSVRLRWLYESKTTAYSSAGRPSPTTPRTRRQRRRRKAGFPFDIIPRVHTSPSAPHGFLLFAHSGRAGTRKCSLRLCGP